MTTIIEERSESQSSYLVQTSPTFCDDQEQKWEERKYSIINSLTVARQYRAQIEALQTQIYNRNLEKIFTESNGVPKKIMSQIKSMKMGKSSKCCSICCDQFQRDELIIQLPCKHIFHSDCARPWLKNSRHCPNCRIDVVQMLSQKQ